MITVYWDTYWCMTLENENGKNLKRGNKDRVQQHLSIFCNNCILDNCKDITCSENDERGPHGKGRRPADITVVKSQKCFTIYSRRR